MRGCDENPLFSVGFLLYRNLFITSFVVRFGSKKVLLANVKWLNERWNKSSICFVQVVWFGTKGKVDPRCIGLFWKLRRF